MTEYLPELWPVLAMVGAFVIGTFGFKLPVSISLVIASVVGALVGGHGFPLRHLVEGTLGYLDPLLIIATAMVFMRMIQASGLRRPSSPSFACMAIRWQIIVGMSCL